MEWLTTGLNILGSLANAGATVAGAVDSIKTNQKNYDLQKENLAYQKDLQNTIFAREDNAVQRRVNDLIKAGLSPTLAAGSAAHAGSVVSTSAPQKRSNLEALMALASVKTRLAEQQRAQTEADIARVNLEQAKMDNNYFKSNNIAPVEARMEWQQQLTNFLVGLVNDWRGGASEGVRKVVDTAFSDVSSNVGSSLDLIRTLNDARRLVNSNKSKGQSKGHSSSSGVVHGGSLRRF